MKQIIKVKYQIGLSENFIDTNFVIFSHDQNTVELYIELNKHMDAVKVLFVGAGIYAERTAEQVADRPARYTVPFDSSLIRTSTPVTAYIYGYIDNDMSYDIGAVKFYVSPSAIDTLQPEEKEYYFEKLEGLMEGFENIFTQAEIARNEYEEQRQLAEDERVNNYLDWTDPETGLEARIDAKIRELNETIFEEIGYFAGENITISDDFVISAKDTVYDDAALAQRVVDLEEEPDYIAGDNITIDENKTISAVDTIYDDSSILLELADKVDKDGNKVLSTYDYDLNAKTKVDAIPENPKYTDTDTIYDDSAILLALADKVDKDGSKVLSTYDYDLAAKNKVDAIPENPKYTDTDTIYDDTALTAAVNNKLNKSSDTLNSYREKYHMLNSNVIDLDNANIFIHALSADTTYSIVNAAAGVAHSFSLIITMGGTLHTVTFPSSVRWHNEDIPDMSEENKQYELLFTTTDGGTIWRASFGGMY